MRNKIYIILIVALFVSGCNSDDVQEFIDEQRGKGITHDTGTTTDGEEPNISIAGQEQDALDVHNITRAAVGVSIDLEWSNSLSQAAQVYADKLSNSGAWEHDPNNKKDRYGENLYTSSEKVTLEVAVKAWANEKQYYTYGQIGDNSTCVPDQMCGHYTQIIWKSTTRVGCAISKYKVDSNEPKGPYKNWYLIVCKYQTPGNIIGRNPY